MPPPFGLPRTWFVPPPAPPLDPHGLGVRTLAGTWLSPPGSLTTPSALTSEVALRGGVGGGGLAPPSMHAPPAWRTHGSRCPPGGRRYPFTACEVFCCEVEALYNTLLEDADLMRLLFSLLDAEPPLACKTAGYFGRVVGQLLLRKTNEMMQYCQENPHILEKLICHIDTTSIADIVKRLVGADEHSSILFMPAYAQWLADTPLVDLLLARLAGHSSEVQANAAEILSAIAHTQPSPLASKLTHEGCIATLFQHALQPGRAVLVPALDVCIALIEPKRSNPELLTHGSPLQETARRAKGEAVAAVVAHLGSLVALLQHQEPGLVLDTTYGSLVPPLGRAKLKVVELLSVLLRSGDPAAELGLVASNSMPVCLELFRAYPFNNMLHHSVTAMIVAGLTRPSEGLIPYLFEHCELLDWITSLPAEVRPLPRGGGPEDPANPRPALRAGYLGHVSQIGYALESVAGGAAAGEAPANRAAVEAYLVAHARWQQWLDTELHPRQEVENVAKWQCGRPAAADLAGIDSGDEYQVRAGKGGGGASVLVCGGGWGEGMHGMAGLGVRRP